MTPRPKLDQWGRPHWSFRLEEGATPPLDIKGAVAVPRCTVCGRQEYACCINTRRDARGVCGFCREDEHE